MNAAQKLAEETTLQEAIESPRLLHPNIGLRDELNAGFKSIRDVLNREAWFDVSNAIRIARQLASALDFAHSNGFLHLGLSPESIFVNREGLAVITGFHVKADSDMEALIEASARQRVTCLSPEQIRGEAIDHKSDLYACGVILYELLTDRPPFNGINEDQIRSKHLSAPPPPIYMLREDVPAEISAIINRLLSKRSTDRFENASDLLGSLQQLGDAKSTTPLTDEIDIVSEIIDPPPVESPSAELEIIEVFPEPVPAGYSLETALIPLQPASIQQREPFTPSQAVNRAYNGRRGDAVARPAR